MKIRNIIGRSGVFSSIKGRLALYFMLLAVAPIFFLGYMAYQSERNALSERVRGHLTSIADIQKNRVASWLMERSNDAKFIAGDEFVSRELALLKSLKDPLKYKDSANYRQIYDIMSSMKKNSGYLELLVLDGKGRVVASTDESVLGESRAEMGYFKGGLSTGLGRYYIQDIYMDPHLHKIAMAFSAPIKAYADGAGAGGVAVIILDMDKSFYPIFEGWPGMRKTGDTLIVRREDSQVVFLSRLRFMPDSPLKLRFRVKDSPKAALYSSGGEEGVIETTDYRGVMVVAAYRYIPEVRWGFIVKEDYDDAFASVDELKRRIVLVVGFTLVLVLFLISMIATRIAQPIVSLSELTKRVAGGDFSVNLPVKRMDEVGSLAVSFNEMASSLVEYRRQVDEKNAELEKANRELVSLTGSLEEKVKARTQELEELNRALISMMEDLDERTGALEKSQDELKRSAKELEESRNRLRENLDIVERANVELRRMDRMKDHFLGMMSHELRTPLSLITGYSSNLLFDRTIKMESRVEEGLEGIYKGAERLRNIVTEMLDVSQIDAKGLRLSFAPTNVGLLMEEVLKELSSFVRERKQKVVIGDYSRLPEALVDSKRMRQVFVNILGNAIKFTPDGGRIDVSFQLRGKGAHLLKQMGLPEKDYLDIVVKDSGIGIDKEELTRIFEKFYEVGEIDKHTTSKYGFLGRGVGLGLPIARGIVEAHGGRLWAESEGHVPERNPGSSFHTLLPVSVAAKERPGTVSPEQAAEAPAEAARISVREPEGAAPGMERPGGPSVLIIEDDSDILDLTVHILEGEYTVHISLNGPDGVEKARKYLPDLILLDVYMEGMNGYEVCEVLKKDESTRNIPVAMFTAGVQRWEVELGYKAGADYYITKPFKPAELLAKVREFAGRTGEPTRHRVD